MKIRHDTEGKIESVGAEIDGDEIDEKTLADDFMNTFSLGKYRAQKNADKTISVNLVPGFVMPEKSVYTVAEIEKMSKEQLLELQAKLQEFIDKYEIRNPKSEI